ncbi:MAG: class I SAM-dependent methyltransferase [Gammaproteobacteria bacterium]
MRLGDLTALDIASGDRTLVFCSHVLEHIPDDRAAMRELHRVLAPGGTAIVAVPIGDGPTDEGPVSSMEERILRFGQKDHVRLYGLDIVDRLEDSGFDIEVLSAADLPLTNLEHGKLVYRSTNHLFVGTRR